MEMNVPQKWTLRRVLAALPDVFREPADVVLAIQIGFFLWRAPYALAKSHVHEYLAELERRRPRSQRSTEVQLARIERLRRNWLRLPFFRKRDSCYLRSLTLYRFLDVGEQPMHLHFGVEERADPNLVRKAHVWISVGARTYEGPPATAGRLREVTLSQAAL